MNRLEVKRIHDEIDAAVKTICAKYNLAVSPTVISYSSNSIKMTISAKTADKDGDITPSFEDNSVMRYLLKSVNPNKLLPPKIIGNTFDVADLGQCKIIDFKRSSRKCLFVVETLDGNRYKVSAEEIKL